MSVKNKKIVIMNSFYYPTIIGGAEVSTQILAELLVKAFEEVVVITTGSHKTGIVYENVNGVKVYRLPYNNLYWKGDRKQHNMVKKILWHVVNIYNFKQSRLLKNLLLKLNPDIIHTQNLTGISFAAWKIAHELNIPLVHTVRDYELLKGSDSNLFRFMSSISKRFSRYVDALTVVSKYTLKEYVKKGFFINAEKNVIYNVVQDKIVGQVKLTSTPQTPLVLSYYGQLVENKGVSFMIQAIKEVPPQVVSRIYIYGEGPMKDEITSLIHNDRRFVYEGKASKEDVYRSMKETDLTIVPSIWAEPFGRVIIESYRQGTPVIASNVGGIPEIILNENFLFEANNKASLMKAIKKYWQAEKKPITDMCLTHSERFNEEYLLLEHLKVYKGLLKEEGEYNQNHQTVV